MGIPHQVGGALDLTKVFVLSNNINNERKARELKMNAKNTVTIMADHEISAGREHQKGKGQ